MGSGRIDLLRQMAIFGGIRDDILELVLNLSHTACVRSGEFFFREGAAGESVFVLEQGKVAVLKAKQGEERLIRHLEAGDCFGEMALLDYFPRSASVLAIEDCVAIEINAACLHQIYQSDIEQFALIEMNMGREVSRRLRDADRQLSESP